MEDLGIAQFTKTYREYREEGGETFSSLFAHIPSVVVDEDLTIDFEDMFNDNYDLREIGSETEQMFAYHLKQYLEKALISYVPKIKIWFDNFNELFGFKVKLEYSSDITSGNKDTYYLNPANTTTTILKVQDVSNSDLTSNKSGEVEVLQSVWGKTRPIIMQQIMELKNIYIECLDSFEPIFMGLY